MDKTKNKNNEKRKKRRILIMILLLFFFITILGFSTYAWFSSTTHATIESIDINVATVTGIQVSVDAINWDNIVTREQIENAYKTYPGAENQLPDTLSNVSTAGAVTNGKLDMFYGLTSEVGDNFQLMTTKEEEMQCTGDEQCNGKHYIAFDIFLLVTSPANIAITPNSSVIPQPGAQDKGTQNAARIGFVLEGTVAGGASVAAQNLRGGRTSYIWEPNYDVHTVSGVLAAQHVYGISTTTSGGSRIPYKGVNREFGDPVFVDKTDESPYFTSVTPKVATTKNFSGEQYLLDIPAGISKIRVYMWLEGQDVDMENEASDSKLQYNLELSMIL